MSINALTQTLHKAKQAEDALVAKVAEIRAEIAQTKRRSRNVRFFVSAPEVAARAEQLVARAAKEVEFIPADFVHSIAGFNAQTDIPFQALEQTLTMGQFFRLLSVADPGLAARIIAAVSMVSYAQGPPSSDTAEQIERDEDRITFLERQDEEIVDQALALGLTVLQHRQEVIDRRATERTAAERNAANIHYWISTKCDEDLRREFAGGLITARRALEAQRDRDQAKGEQHYGGLHVNWDTLIAPLFVDNEE